MRGIPISLRRRRNHYCYPCAVGLSHGRAFATRRGSSSSEAGGVATRPKKIVNFVSIVTWTGTESQPKGRAGMGQTGCLQVVVDVPPYIHPLGLEDNLALSAVASGSVV